MPRAHFMRDQADGLRRLLGKNGLRVLRLNSGRRGAGKTSIAVNLAAALAGKGREVLIVDENASQGNAADNLGQGARHDLSQVICGECGLDQAIRRVAGISLLSVAQGLAELARLPHEARLALADTLAKSCPGYDVVIIDSVAGSGGDLLPLAVAGQEELLVVPGSAAGITDAYAFIKGASGEYGRRRYRVLMSKVRDEQRARAMFDNMARAARGYLGIELELMGMIPSDEKFKRASSVGKPLLTAFPDAPSAAVFRRLGLAVTEWPRLGDDGGDMSAFLHGLIRCGAAGSGAGEARRRTVAIDSAAWRVPRKTGHAPTESGGRRGPGSSRSQRQGLGAV